jgi:hypothetical protein
MENKKQMFCTLGWDGHPTTCDENGRVLLRKAEMLFYANYYPNGTIGEYPIDPITKEKLPIYDFNNGK